MRFAILIHSNPRPWAHPTSGHTAEYQALPQEEKDRLQAHWEEVYGRAEADGEVVYHCALAEVPEALQDIMRSTVVRNRTSIAADGVTEPER